MANLRPKNIVIKFDLTNLETEADNHKQDYWEYVWHKTLQGLDLSKIEGVELLSGDSEGTVIHSSELVYCIGFTYNNKEQFNYLKNHSRIVFKRVKSAIRIEIDAKDPLSPEAVVRDGKLLQEDCHKSRNIELHCRELQRIYKEVNNIETETYKNVYIANLFVGVLIPGKKVTKEEAEHVLDNSIYHGIYRRQEIIRFKINLVMSVVFFGLFAHMAVSELINGNYTNFLIAFTISHIMWTVVVKYGSILLLLQHFMCVIMTVPKISGITLIQPKRHRKYHKLLLRGTKDFPISIAGTFLPKKIVAIL